MINNTWQQSTVDSKQQQKVSEMLSMCWSSLQRTCCGLNTSVSSKSRQSQSSSKSGWEVPAGDASPSCASQGHQHSRPSCSWLGLHDAGKPAWHPAAEWLVSGSLRQDKVEQSQTAMGSNHVQLSCAQQQSEPCMSACVHCASISCQSIIDYWR